MLTIFIYVILIVIILFLQKKSWKSDVFKSQKKVSWFISGLSLYMFYLSADHGQFLTGLIAEHGMAGLWMVWAGLLGSFVVPLVFAPLWQRLDFLTDNQFLLFRYTGNSAKFLHFFRAIYVGGLVVALSLCFHTLGFSRILELFFQLDKTNALLLTGGILALFSLKNVFDLKLKMDAFHAFLFFLSFVIILFSIASDSNVWSEMYRFLELHPEKRSLFPQTESKDAWFSIIVFIGIQWWSCYLFDGGGPEMARFTAVKGRKHAILAGFLQIVISVVIGILMVILVLFLLGKSDNVAHPELQYVQQVYAMVPEALHGIVFLGFFGMFITTAESLLNWGASFITVDAYKGYVNPSVDEKRLRIIAFVTMVSLSLLSLVFSLNFDSLQSLVKVSFSIAAGVAPLYILRWVWFRINAWSQLSAMVSSAIFTLIYPYFHDVLPLSDFPMSESRVLVVTVLTSMVWIAVTLLTPNRSAAVRLNMLPIIESRNSFLKRLIVALFLGLILFCAVILFWFLILGK